MPNSAIAGNELAKAKGVNRFWGSEIKYGRTQWSFFTSKKPDEILDFGISNVGSALDRSNCVPTTFAEIERKRGGTKGYKYYKKSTNYIDNTGI